jgi:peptide/nickel transport system permease protein
MSRPGVSEPGAVGVAIPAAVPARGSTNRRRRRRPLFAGQTTSAKVLLVIAFVWAAIVIVVALTCQWLPIADPARIVGHANVGPGWTKEVLGTDGIGRSMLSRLCFGARTSLFISVCSAALALAIGGLIGITAAYFRGLVNALTDLIANTILAIPALLFLLAIVLALGGKYVVLISALTIVFIPAFYRLMRANGLTQMSSEYIAAARGLGASSNRIMWRELLPNTVLSLLSYALIVLPSIIILEGSLSFLGFGVPPPTPSWGAMIAQGEPQLTSAPWQAFAPCLILGLTVFSLNTIGDYARVRFDVRSGQR